MSSHSSIGASSSDRWLNCPGSIELAKQLPKEGSSIYAARGTAAHLVLEKCFNTTKDPWSFEGFEYEGGELDDEDIEAVESSIEYLDDEAEGMTIYKETKINLSKPIYAGLWGTADIVMESEDKTILIVDDYKHGVTYVEVENNSQLVYYALGAIWKLAKDLVPIFGWGGVYKEVWIGIVQPRCGHKKGPNRRWLVPPEVLDSFAEELRLGAIKTEQPNAEIKEGKHCSWCPAVSVCPLKYAKKLEKATTEFTVITEEGE